MIESNPSETLKTALDAYFDPTTSSIIAGIAFGIKANLDYQLYKNIKTAGLSHLIVFSGSNIVIIYSIITQSLYFLKSKLRIIVACVLMIGFLTLIPKEPSIVRATIMWGLTIISSLADKKTSKIYVALTTVFIMVILEPKIIENISFQLSVSAVFGILLFDKKGSEETEINILQNVKNDLKTTISAQVFTVPLIYYYFGSLNLLSPISNLLAGPLIRPIIYIGIVSQVMHILTINNIYAITIFGRLLVRLLIIVVNIFS